MENNSHQSKDGNRTQRDAIHIQELAKLKQRLISSNIPEKVALLFDAINYGQQGLDLIIQQALEDDSEQIKQAAYWVLQGHNPYLAYVDHPSPTEFAFPTDTISSLAIASNSQTLAGGSWKIIRFWDLNTGKLIRTIEAHSNWILSLAISLKEQIIVSGSADKTIKIWHLNSGKIRHNLIGHSSWVNALAITPDGKKIISASADYTLKLWEIKSGKLIHTFEGHSGSVSSIAIALNGNILISGSADKTIKLWDLNKRILLQTIDGHSDWVQAIAVNSKSDKIISDSRNGEIRVWQLDASENQPTPKKELSNLESIGKYLSSIFSKNREDITKFTHNQWTCLKTYDLNQSPINCLLLESSDTRLFIVGENVLNPILYYISMIQQFFGHDFEPQVYHLGNGVATFGLDKNHLVMGNYNWISIFNLNTGEITQTIEGFSRPSLKSLEISPSNQEIEFGQCIQLQVQGFYGQQITPVTVLTGVIWQIVQGHGNIDSDGKFSAGDIEETVTITAKVKDITAAKSIKVLEPAKLHSLVIAPETGEIKPDERCTFTVQGKDQYDRHIHIDSREWTVSSGGKMEGSTFIPENNAKGSFTVTVKAVAKGITKSTQANITVISVLTRIQIHPAHISLEPNQRQKFQVMGFDQTDEEMKISEIHWEATGGRIDAQGNFIAGNDEKGNFQVTAIVGTHQTKADVEIIPVLRELTISPSEVELETEQSCTFQVTGLDQHKDEIQIPEVNWQISEVEFQNNDAKIDEKTGYFIAGKNVGHFQVTATVGQNKAEALVVVKKLTGLVIFPNESEIIEIEFGQCIDLTVQGRYQSVAQLPSQMIPLSEVTWNISEPIPCCSRIEPNGKFYAGDAQENVTITATFKDITAAKSIKVLEPAKLQSLVIAPETGEIKPDERCTFTVQGKDQYDRHIHIDSLEWTVSGGGKMEGSTFIPDKNAKGSFTVTVKAVANGITKSTQANITVISVLKRIQIHPAQISLEPNQSQKFQVMGFDQTHEEMKISEIHWEATGGIIDTQGNFIAGNDENGNFQVTAIVGKHCTQADVEIIPVLTELTILLSGGDAEFYENNLEIEFGKCAYFTVQGFDQVGSLIYQLPPVRWTIKEQIKHHSIIDDDGQFYAGHVEESVTIIATVKDITASKVLKVLEPAKLTFLDLWPTNAKINPDQHQKFTVEGYDQRFRPIDIGSVEWTVSGGGKIEGSTFVPDKNAKGTFTITVKSIETDISKSKDITVVQVLRRIEIQPNHISLEPKETYQFQVLSFDQKDEPISDETFYKSINWQCTHGGKIHREGLFIGNYKNNQVNVTATTDFRGSSCSAEATVTLLPVVRRLQIETDGQPIKLEQGQSYTFKAIAFDQYDNQIDPETLKITWEATGGEIDENGKFTADLNALGTFFVTATTTKETKSQQRLRIVALGIYLKFLDWLLSLSFVEDFLAENFDNFADNQGLTSDSMWINILIDGVEQWVFKTILNLISRILNWFSQLCLAQGIDRISASVEFTIVIKPLKNLKPPEKITVLRKEIYAHSRVFIRGVIASDKISFNVNKCQLFYDGYSVNEIASILDEVDDGLRFLNYINYSDYLSYIEYNLNHINDNDNWLDDYE